MGRFSPAHYDDIFRDKIKGACIHALQQLHDEGEIDHAVGARARLAHRNAMSDHQSEFERTWTTIENRRQQWLPVDLTSTSEGSSDSDGPLRHRQAPHATVDSSSSSSSSSGSDTTAVPTVWQPASPSRRRRQMTYTFEKLAEHLQPDDPDLQRLCKVLVAKVKRKVRLQQDRAQGTAGRARPSVYVSTREHRNQNWWTGTGAASIDTVDNAQSNNAIDLQVPMTITIAEDGITTHEGIRSRTLSRSLNARVNAIDRSLQRSMAARAARRADNAESDSIASAESLSAQRSRLAALGRIPPEHGDAATSSASAAFQASPFRNSHPSDEADTLLRTSGDALPRLGLDEVGSSSEDGDAADPGQDDDAVRIRRAFVRIGTEVEWLRSHLQARIDERIDEVWRERRAGEESGFLGAEGTDNDSLTFDFGASTGPEGASGPTAEQRNRIIVEGREVDRLRSSLLKTLETLDTALGQVWVSGLMEEDADQQLWRGLSDLQRQRQEAMEAALLPRDTDGTPNLLRRQRERRQTMQSSFLRASLWRTRNRARELNDHADRIARSSGAALDTLPSTEPDDDSSTELQDAGSRRGRSGRGQTRSGPSTAAGSSNSRPAASSARSTGSRGRGAGQTQENQPDEQPPEEDQQPLTSRPDAQTNRMTEEEVAHRLFLHRLDQCREAAGRSNATDYDETLWRWHIACWYFARRSRADIPDPAPRNEGIPADPVAIAFAQSTWSAYDEDPYEYISSRGAPSRETNLQAAWEHVSSQLRRIDYEEDGGEEPASLDSIEAVEEMLESSRVTRAIELQKEARRRAAARNAPAGASRGSPDDAGFSITGVNWNNSVRNTSTRAGPSAGPRQAPSAGQLVRAQPRRSLLATDWTVAEPNRLSEEEVAHRFFFAALRATVSYAGNTNHYYFEEDDWRWHLALWYFAKRDRNEFPDPAPRHEGIPADPEASAYAAHLWSPYDEDPFLHGRGTGAPPRSAGLQALWEYNLSRLGHMEDWTLGHGEVEVPVGEGIVANGVVRASIESLKDVDEVLDDRRVERAVALQQQMRRRAEALNEIRAARQARTMSAADARSAQGRNASEGDPDGEAEEGEEADPDVSLTRTTSLTRRNAIRPAASGDRTQPISAMVTRRSARLSASTSARPEGSDDEVEMLTVGSGDASAQRGNLDRARSRSFTFVTTPAAVLGGSRGGSRNAAGASGASTTTVLGRRRRTQAEEEDGADALEAAASLGGRGRYADLDGAEEAAASGASTPLEARRATFEAYARRRRSRFNELLADEADSANASDVEAGMPAVEEIEEMLAFLEGSDDAASDQQQSGDEDGDVSEGEEHRRRMESLRVPRQRASR